MRKLKSSMRITVCMANAFKYYSVAYSVYYLQKSEFNLAIFIKSEFKSLII